MHFDFSHILNEEIESVGGIDWKEMQYLLSSFKYVKSISITWIKPRSSLTRSRQRERFTDF